MNAFGLDLSDAWIRLAALEHKRQHLQLPVRGEIPVPPGMIVDGEIQNPQGVSDLLHQLVQATGLRGRRAYISLPERHTFIKSIAIPASEGQSTEEEVRTEAAQHLPYSWEDMYFDYSILPDRLPDKRQAAVIGAAPRGLVDTYVKTISNAGIEPIGMEIESLAIARAVIAPGQEPPAAIILDLGRTRSTLILVEHGVVQFSVTVRYAGKELNSFIRDALNITDQQAERAKSIFGLDAKRGKGVLRKVLLPQIQVLANKIDEVQGYYQEHFPNPQPISHVYITGSGALLRGIDEVLTSATNIPAIVQPSWIFEQLQHDEPGLNPEIAYTYTTAFGLCITEVNSV